MGTKTLAKGKRKRQEAKTSGWPTQQELSFPLTFPPRFLPFFFHIPSFFSFPSPHPFLSPFYIPSLLLPDSPFLHLFSLSFPLLLSTFFLVFFPPFHSLHLIFSSYLPTSLPYFLLDIHPLFTYFSLTFSLFLSTFFNFFPFFFFSSPHLFLSPFYIASLLLPD